MAGKKVKEPIVPTIWPEERIREELRRLDRKTGLHGAELPIEFYEGKSYLGWFYPLPIEFEAWREFGGGFSGGGFEKQRIVCSSSLLKKLRPFVGGPELQTSQVLCTSKYVSKINHKRKILPVLAAGPPIAGPALVAYI